jgi:hypothetical protein
MEVKGMVVFNLTRQCGFIAALRVAVFLLASWILGWKVQESPSAALLRNRDGAKEVGTIREVQTYLRISFRAKSPAISPKILLAPDLPRPESPGPSGSRRRLQARSRGSQLLPK